MRPTRSHNRSSLFILFCLINCFSTKQEAASSSRRSFVETKCCFDAQPSESHYKITTTSGRYSLSRGALPYQKRGKEALLAVNSRRQKSFLSNSSLVDLLFPQCSCFREKLQQFVGFNQLSHPPASNVLVTNANDVLAVGAPLLLLLSVVVVGLGSAIAGQRQRQHQHRRRPVGQFNEVSLTHQSVAFSTQTNKWLLPFVGCVLLIIVLVQRHSNQCN